jgi:hypothetical protein
MILNGLGVLGAEPPGTQDPCHNERYRYPFCFTSEKPSAVR